MLNRRNFLKALAGLATLPAVPLLDFLKPKPQPQPDYQNNVLRRLRPCPPVHEFPIRQDTTVLLPTEPERLSLGWVRYELVVAIFIDDHVLTEIP